MIKVFKYALVVNSTLKKKIDDLYRVMHEKNNDSHERRKEEWSRSKTAAEKDLNSAPFPFSYFMGIIVFFRHSSI